MITWRAWRMAATLLPLALLATVACSDPPDEPDDPYVVESIPWEQPESLEYVLVEDDGDEIGRGTLSILEADGGTLLVQQFSDDEGFTDDSVLLVRPDSLAPMRGNRAIYDASGDERRVVDTEYGTLDDGDFGVRIRQRVFDPASDEEPDSTRCNPLTVPESSFDNDSSLFLWRTLPFEDELEVAYTASIANRRDTRVITLLVDGQDTVETPAGTFEAWHVRILAEGQSHDAWYDVDPPHRLVRYDNDQQIFLYVGETDAPPEVDVPQGVPADCE